jgi:hypothetical protein
MAIFLVIIAIVNSIQMSIAIALGWVLGYLMATGPDRVAEWIEQVRGDDNARS